MLPAEGVLVAAERWLRLLSRSDFQQASALIRTDPTFTDLSPTQYATALDWLVEGHLVEDGPGGRHLTSVVQQLPNTERKALLFATSLEAVKPPWLQDADTLVRTSTDVPDDARMIAEAIGISDAQAFLGVRQVHGRIDLARRAEVGLAGELALVGLLEEAWPGCTGHVSQEHDGLGYDISLSIGQATWHVEVKSTTRRGRLLIYLSRQEYEIGMLDADWQLVVLGLDDGGHAACLASVDKDALRRRAPRDLSATARWQAARFELTPNDLRGGLALPVEPASASGAASLLFSGIAPDAPAFAWMPEHQPSSSNTSTTRRA